MKAFINKTQDIVSESIDGLLINEKLAKLDRFPEVRVVVRRDWDKSRVALISGGGSGHEPTHAGFVGEGMLTAAVCGDIFASPSVDAVLSAIKAVTGDAGCLLIIKNYTGDRLNFGLAAEQARAMGYKVETVTVGDDIALGTDVRRRGVAGTLFVHKVAGQLAAAGKSLEEVARIAHQVADNTISIGLALTECQMFGGQKEMRLTDAQAELGLGIHGEPGAEIVDYVAADKLMEITAKRLEEKLPDPKADYVVLLNNLGTVTPIEMNVLANALNKTSLASRLKYIVGPSWFMTALNMSGFSISVLKLTPEIESALLADVEPVAWMKARKFVQPASIATPPLAEMLPYKASSNATAQAVIEKAAHAFIAIEDEINALDAKVGDGDAGATFAAASRTILSLVDKLPFADGKELLESIGRIFSREAGGSSGVLMSIMFIGAANGYEVTHDWGKALLAGLDKMKQYGGAKLGDRTMIDALEPAFKALAEGKSLADAAKAARLGSDSTKNIKKTQFGRSSYVPEELLSGIADPGAEAMARVFEKLAE
jgi:ATP-dependent dihydroxyacetone kinase